MPGMDALSLRPLLEGQREAHREVLISGLNGWRAVYDGRWKLVAHPRYLLRSLQPLLDWLRYHIEVRHLRGIHRLVASIAFWTYPRLLAPLYPERPASLYDTITDPHEDHDVAAQHPEIVVRLRAALRESNRPHKDIRE
jgi:hypothetical protein